MQACVDDEVIFMSEYSDIEEYQWNINAVQVGNEALLSQIFNEPGEYIIQLVAENPVCEEASSIMISVIDLPSAQITENGAILTASEAESYQWLLNGEEIENATEQTYLPTEDGAYSVIVTNEGNCSSTSAEVMIVSISELENSTILIYPNPMTDVAFIDFKDPQPRTIRLLDAQGKEVRVWNNIATQRLEILKGDLPSGNYVVSVLEDSKTYSIQLIIE